MIGRTDLIELIARLRTEAPRIVVLGDVILDRWWSGPAQRMSREAPVPVVEADTVVDCPGGAANTAANLAALGARVRLVSAVGDDEEGRTLLASLDSAGVDIGGVEQRPGACTTSKTRVVGAEQILVRVDRLGDARLPLDALLGHLDGADAVVVCDYGNGLLGDAALAALAAGRERLPLLVVDAHDPARWRPTRPDVITPNAGETALLLGERLDGDRPAAAEERWGAVLTISGARAAVVTLDRDGTVVIGPDGPESRTSAHPVRENQASGAGDTFTAALAAALATGAALTVAADLAQAAADVVVRRPGTSVCTADDLLAAVGDDERRMLTGDDLAASLRRDRDHGRRIVFTNGCFDVIHRGHTTHLRQAKALGDVLVVALNDDESVRRLKGPDRPLNPLADRAAVLGALDCVDYVTVFSADTPRDLLDTLRPDVYAKGGDYTPEMLTETETVRSYGGEVRILDYLPDRSTSGMVKRIVARVGHEVEGKP
ncbi:D-glycero-beta-D-manno-heptose 1-phosphate adenylyltransferase [Cnuibacter sp. UC19_7]|uniref:D-glycero-beta-D-manno-heptose 1-phosphate adenylyltransferase n=1 Tax=Cnuibacter sp. UC19_7 TaxID=3350166 RepID=UPI003672F697